MNCIERVMTTKEASEKYPVADSTLRMWIGDGEFKATECRKSGNTWLVMSESLERVLRKKGIIEREFYLKGEHYIAERLGFRGSKIEIWFETTSSSEVFKNMPFSEMLISLMKIYKKEHCLKFKEVLIVKNEHFEDATHNLLYEKDQVWLMTEDALFRILIDALEFKNINTNQLSLYYTEARTCIV